MIDTDRLKEALAKHAHVTLGHHPTPIDHLAGMSRELGISLYAKRDDCNGLAFGGNKVRQLEYYLGPAVAAKADTVLVTGAIQSNFVRTTAAAAAKLGMAAEMQLEDRVPDADKLYHRSGNVLLNQMLGASLSYFPEGEDEAAADRALDERAARLRDNGRHPYVIHLGADHMPIGGLGYAAAVAETLAQLDELPDVVVIPSGSGLTHAGFLAGARACGWDVPIIGICVRRAATLQYPRVLKRVRQVIELLGIDVPLDDEDVIVRDQVLHPGYGMLNDDVAKAIDLAARREALLLDPVYSGRAMAGLIECIDAKVIAPNAKVLFIHTGGNPGVFAYQDKLSSVLEHIDPIDS
jgi:D-cysteine desulfhydrase/L-cysteate sulfo-lyase